MALRYTTWKTTGIVTTTRSPVLFCSNWRVCSSTASIECINSGFSLIMWSKCSIVPHWRCAFKLMVTPIRSAIIEAYSFFIGCSLKYNLSVLEHKSKNKICGFLTNMLVDELFPVIQGKFFTKWFSKLLLNQLCII